MNTKEERTHGQRQNRMKLNFFPTDVFQFFSNLVIIFVLAVEDFRFAPSVTAGVRVCVITSHKFVNTVPYKPLVGILPKLQLRCSWGER